LRYNNNLSNNDKTLSKNDKYIQYLNSNNNIEKLVGKYIKN
jgi:hypothetical protein